MQIALRARPSGSRRRTGSGRAAAATDLAARLRRHLLGGCLGGRLLRARGLWRRRLPSGDAASAVLPRPWPLAWRRPSSASLRPGRRHELHPSRRRPSSARSASVAAAASSAAFLVARFGLARSLCRWRGLRGRGRTRRRPVPPRPRRGSASRHSARGLGLGDRHVAPDVDPPAGQAGREPGVLALAADGQREHPLGDGDAGDPVLLVDVDRDDLGRAQGVGHEDRRVVAPRDDVDLLAGQLRDDGLDARAALADGRADRVEPLLARRDRDLRAAARLAGDRLDLDRPAVDLGDLELEQALQEALVRAADEDLRAAVERRTSSTNALTFWPIR